MLIVIPLAVAQVIRPCTEFQSGTGTDSYESVSLDTTGYYCLPPVGTIYSDDYKLTGINVTVTYKQAFPPRTVNTTQFLQDLYREPKERATQSGTCDCVNQPISWKAEHLSLDSPLSTSFVDAIRSQQPLTARFDPVSNGSPCDFTRLGESNGCLFFGSVLTLMCIRRLYLGCKPPEYRPYYYEYAARRGTTR